MTVDATAAAWLDVARLGLRATSVEHYETVLRLYILPRVGDRELRSLDGDDWHDLARHLLRRLGANSVSLVLTVARLIYRHARLPAPLDDAIVLVRLARRKIKQTCPLTRAESERLVPAMLRVAPWDYALYVLLLARTGIRPGEGAAVRIRNIDVPGRRLRIEDSFTRTALGPTKSGHTRLVDLSAGLATLLGQAIQGRPHGDWLFPGQAPDRPRNTSCYRRYMKRALADAGLPTTHHPHCCRHGFATILLEEGLADLFYVQRQLGHSRIGTTCDLYARHAQPRNLGAVDALDGGAEGRMRDVFHDVRVSVVGLRRARERRRA